MRRRRAAALVAVALIGALALPSCADPDATPVAEPADQPCGREVDPATARVVDVYAAMLRHLVGHQRDHQVDGSGVLYLVDHAVPQDQGGFTEREKQTPAPASRSTAEFPAPLRRCLEGAHFDGLPPIGLVEDWDDLAIPTEPVPGQDRSPGDPWRRIVGGRVFYLGGVPDRGDRLALAASSSGGVGFDYSGGLFVLERRDDAWRVAGRASYWVS